MTPLTLDQPLLVCWRLAEKKKHRTSMTSDDSLPVSKFPQGCLTTPARTHSFPPGPQLLTVPTPSFSVLFQAPALPPTPNICRSYTQHTKHRSGDDQPLSFLYSPPNLTPRGSTHSSVLFQLHPPYLLPFVELCHFTAIVPVCSTFPFLRVSLLCM